MIDVIHSINNVPIRFTAERWEHIRMGHPEMAAYYQGILDTMQMPDMIYAGGRNELLAVRALPASNDKNLIVVYKEVDAADGFIITAYVSNKVNELHKRVLVWQRQN